MAAIVRIVVGILYTWSMQLVPITANVVSWNPVHGVVYLIQHHVIESLSVT